VFLNLNLPLSLVWISTSTRFSSISGKMNTLGFQEVAPQDKSLYITSKQWINVPKNATAKSPVARLLSQMAASAFWRALQKTSNTLSVKRVMTCMCYRLTWSWKNQPQKHQVMQNMLVNIALVQLKRRWFRE
jgi:hypothetical protein